LGNLPGQEELNGPAYANWIGFVDYHSLNKEKPMLYYADMAIDAIQSSKSAWLNTFIKEETVRKPLQQFVDAQTSFTKQVTKTLYDVTGAAAKAMVEKTFNKEAK
jgi:hypothetical protein